VTKMTRQKGENKTIGNKKTGHRGAKGGERGEKRRKGGGAM